MNGQKFFLQILNQYICNYLPNIRFEKPNYINIDTCFFTRSFVYKGTGAVIYCSFQQCNMYLNNCIFYDCGCTLSGGAIHFYCTNLGTNSYLNKVCGNKCFTGINNQWQFARIECHDSLDSNNYCNLCSISNCNSIDQGYNSIFFNYGVTNVNHLNSSKNINKRYSGIIFAHQSSFQSSFCSIINNYVSDYGIIQLRAIIPQISFSFYNVVFNKSPTSPSGVIQSTNNNKIYIFENSVFYNNLNTLFYAMSGEIHIRNCKIFHNSAFTTFKGKCVTTNNQFGNYNTLEILHLNTYLCTGNTPLPPPSKIGFKYSGKKFLSSKFLIILHLVI